MRGRRNDAKSYALPQPLNEVMIGGTTGEVVESRHPSFAAGDQVVGMGGWQEYSVVDGGARAIRKVDTSRIRCPRISDQSACRASPPVRTAQDHRATSRQHHYRQRGERRRRQRCRTIARAKGCRAIGFAGGPEKCRYVTDESGFDACIDYKAHSIERRSTAR